MSLVTALIVDDEEHNRDFLKMLLEKHCPQIKVLAEVSNADDAFENITSLKPQIVFLDIRMPNKSGFDLLKLFKMINFEVIFVSGFNEYAITAFDFNALGYILKPIDHTKLITVVDKAILKINSAKNDNVLHFIKTLDDTTNLVDKITIHHKDKVVFVPINNIISVESIIDMCEIKLVDRAKYFSGKTLKLFENMLESFDNFIRIDKSVIINTNYIKSYTKGEVCTIFLVDGNEFEVSRRKKGEVLNRIKTL